MITIQTAFAADGRRKSAKCEEDLTGGRTLARLVQVIAHDHLNEAVSYRIRMSASNLPAESFGKIERISRSVSKFGSSFELMDVSASGSKINFDFELTGPGRNVVQFLMELSDPKWKEEYGLEPVSWSPRTLESGTVLSAQASKKLRTKLEDLDFSVRTYNAFKNAEFNYLGDVVTKTDSELLSLKSFGRKSLREVKAKMQELKLTLGMKTPGWPFKD